MAAKLLIDDRRERRALANDILYLHDSIELFGASLDVLTATVETGAAAGRALTPEGFQELKPKIGRVGTFEVP